jgi:hypothetical protein
MFINFLFLWLRTKDQIQIFSPSLLAIDTLQMNSFSNFLFFISIFGKISPGKEMATGPRHGYWCPGTSCCCSCTLRMLFYMF